MKFPSAGFSWTRRSVVVVAAALVCALALSGWVMLSSSTPPADASPPRTIVSLTFDDANDNQQIAVDLLNEHDLPGTFYVPSGYIDKPGQLTEKQLKQMAEDGHEIGGHTATHANLTEIPAGEAAQEICSDRQKLADLGFEPRSLAYPFAASNETVRALAKECGYSSARGLGGLDMSDEGDVPSAESIPPPDPFLIRALPQVETDWTLDDLKNAVIRAEETGGWVTLTFHRVCESGCEISVTPEDFEAFLTWLEPRTKYGTVVRTVGDVIDEEPRPVVPEPAEGALQPGKNGVVNNSYEELDPDGTPRCWMRGGFGTNASQFSTTEAARSGTVAGQVTLSGHTDGDAKWLPSFDRGDCSTTVTPGRQYSLRGWYTSDTKTQFAIYLRDQDGAWHYWTSSPWFAATDEYTQAVWTTPKIPKDMTGLSFGLNLFSDGVLTTDDLEIYDSIGAPGLGAPAQDAGVGGETPKVSPKVEPQGEPAVRE